MDKKWQHPMTVREIMESEEVGNRQMSDKLSAERDWSDEIMALTYSDLEDGVHEQLADVVRAEFAALEAKLSKTEDALNLMLASPKDRLEYCEANDLLPSIITATESVDPYWREAIAREALAGDAEEEA